MRKIRRRSAREWRLTNIDELVFRFDALLLSFDIDALLMVLFCLFGEFASILLSSLLPDIFVPKRPLVPHILLLHIPVVPTLQRSF